MNKGAAQNSILIAGTGAMASLFAARLSAANIKVTLLGNWSEALDAIRNNGIRLIEEDGREVHFPVDILREAADCEPFKYALVLVKSWQTRRTAQQLQHCISQDGIVLTLQNGLGNQDILVEYLGEKRVALGVTTMGAALQAPGIVRPGGDGVILFSDDVLHTNERPSIGELVKILLRAGFQVQSVTNPDSLVWGKLVINAAINPVTALLNINNGGILENQMAYEIMRAAGDEAALVARAQGIPLPYPDPTKAAEAIIRKTATNRSSMLQDLSRGAPTEINSINGAIVTIGKQLGVPTPVNWALWKLVQAIIDQKAASRGKDVNSSHK